MIKGLIILTILKTIGLFNQQNWAEEGLQRLQLIYACVEREIVALFRHSRVLRISRMLHDAPNKTHQSLFYLIELNVEYVFGGKKGFSLPSPLSPPSLPHSSFPFTLLPPLPPSPISFPSRPPEFGILQQSNRLKQVFFCCLSI